MIVWARAGGMNFSRSYFVPSYEVVFLIAKADFRLVKKASGLSDVWTIQQARDNEHPAPFPVELARRAIASVDPGLTVFDPFLGSGTTAVAAEALGRKWFGCELSPEYVKMAARRIREQRERMKLAGVLGAAR
jgi:DNA modification methylase